MVLRANGAGRAQRQRGLLLTPAQDLRTCPGGGSGATMVGEVMFMSTRRAILGLAAAPFVSVAVATAAVMITGAHRRLGLTRQEAAAPLPGDDLLPDATVQNDRAILINAAPERIWPWLAQIGQDKAGFYSFEMLENLAGCQITGATRIHPEWQDVRAGDTLALHPRVQLRIAAVDPEVLLAATNAGTPMLADTGMGYTWTFHLVPLNDPDSDRPLTRLHVRERYASQTRLQRAPVEATSLISALMTWRMLTRIAGLVEGSITPAAEPDRPVRRR